MELMSVVSDVKDKNDGMQLIIEISYSLADLQDYIKQSCLSEKCDFLETTQDVEEICQNFINFLKNDELNLDEISTMFVAASLCFFVDATPENFEWRSQLLQKTFQYADTLSPIHLHVATKRLWEALHTDDISFLYNLMSLSHQISFASETGRAIAICLVWTVLCKITETDYEMCSFREFGELVKMLNDLDDVMLQREDNIRIVYILVHCIGFLITAVVFGRNDDFKKAGYRNYFSYTKRELEKLKKYAEQLTGLLKISISGAENYFELRMTITEYINVNIIGILQEKISEMQTNK